MPFNQSGIFSRLYSWVADAANGIKIRADRMDAELNNIASALSNCVLRDGTGRPSAHLDMNSKRLENLGAPVNAQDAIRKSEIDTEIAARVLGDQTNANAIAGVSNAATVAQAAANASNANANAAGAAAITAQNQAAAAAAAAVAAQNTANSAVNALPAKADLSNPLFPNGITPKTGSLLLGKITVQQGGVPPTSGVADGDICGIY